jgi:hypothetical protein
MFQKTINEVMCQRIYGALPLSYGAYDLHQSRAGGTRTHDIRLLMHVLQLGSRSLSLVATKEIEQTHFQVGARTYQHRDAFILI